MTESTWHASCLKHDCLVAMVGFTGMEPTYHRVNGADGCTCPLETLVIHHMNHSPLDALKDTGLQICELREFIEEEKRKTGFIGEKAKLQRILDHMHKTRDLRTKKGACPDCGTTDMCSCESIAHLEYSQKDPSM